MAKVAGLLCWAAARTETLLQLQKASLGKGRLEDSIRSCMLHTTDNQQHQHVHPSILVLLTGNLLWATRPVWTLTLPEKSTDVISNITPQIQCFAVLLSS